VIAKHQAQHMSSSLQHSYFDSLNAVHMSVETSDQIL